LGTLKGAALGSVLVVVPVVVVACPEAGKLPVLELTCTVGAVGLCDVEPFESVVCPLLDVPDDPEKGFAVGVENGWD